MYLWNFLVDRSFCVEAKENPFKPGGILSDEAEVLIQCWRQGKGWTFSENTNLIRKEWIWMKDSTMV